MSFRARHRRHTVMIGLLVLTGLGLFLPSWRTAVSGFLPAVQDVHEFGGIIYGLAIVAWTMKVFPWPKNPMASPGFTRWAFFFLIMLTVTGVGLLVGPSWTHAVATVAHALFSAIFIFWVLWHLVRNVPRPARSRRAPWVQRRRFLTWGLYSLLALPAIWSTPTMLRLVGGSLLGKAGGQTDGALPGFVPYTVVDGYPTLSLDTWALRLEGLGSPRQYSWAQWQTFSTTDRVIDFRCVTGWEVPHVRFTGVDLVDWLMHEGWDPHAFPWLTFYSGDGIYTESLSADQILQYRPLLASHIDGRPLPVSQGFPLRLVVPNMYGYKSIKWLVRIQAGQKDQLGYWEVRGYPENAYFGSYTGI